MRSGIARNLRSVVRGVPLGLFTSLFSGDVTAAPPAPRGADVQAPAPAPPPEPPECPTTIAGFSMMVARVEAIYEARGQGDFAVEAPRMSACFFELEEPLTSDLAWHYLRARAYSQFAVRNFPAVEAALKASLDIAPDARLPKPIAPGKGHPLYDAQQRALDGASARAEPVPLPEVTRMTWQVNGEPATAYQPDELSAVQLKSPAVGVFYNRELYPGESMSLDDVPGIELAQRQIASQIQLSDRVWIAGGVSAGLAGGAAVFTGLQQRSLQESDEGTSGRTLNRALAGRTAAAGFGAVAVALGVTGAVIRW